MRALILCFSLLLSSHALASNIPPRVLVTKQIAYIDENESQVTQVAIAQVNGSEKKYLIFNIIKKSRTTSTQNEIVFIPVSTQSANVLLGHSVARVDGYFKEVEWKLVLTKKESSTEVKLYRSEKLVGRAAELTDAPSFHD